MEFFTVIESYYNEQDSRWGVDLTAEKFVCYHAEKADCIVWKESFIDLEEATAYLIEHRGEMSPVDYSFLIYKLSVLDDKKREQQADN